MDAIEADDAMTFNAEKIKQQTRKKSQPNQRVVENKEAKKKAVINFLIWPDEMKKNYWPVMKNDKSISPPTNLTRLTSHGDFEENFVEVDEEDLNMSRSSIVNSTDSRRVSHRKNRSSIVNINE